MKVDDIKKKYLLSNCTYLEDSEIIISGIKIYGTPWYVLVFEYEITDVSFTYAHILQIVLTEVRFF